jgi:hypothetical protein
MNTQELDSFLLNEIFRVLEIESVMIEHRGIFNKMYATKNHIYLCLDTSDGVVAIPGLDIEFIDSDIENYTHMFKTSDLGKFPSYQLYLSLLKSSTFSEYNFVIEQVLVAIYEKTKKTYTSFLIDIDNMNKEVLFFNHTLYLNDNSYFKKGSAEPSEFKDYRYKYKFSKLDQRLDDYLLMYILEA